MVNKKTVNKAKRTLEEYDRQVKKRIENITKFTCICCKRRKITLYNPIKQLDLVSLEQHMWKNGTVDLISYGYGSSNDGEAFFIAICDPCTEELKKDGYIKRTKDVATVLKTKEL